jgi:hypothetical protein
MNMMGIMQKRITVLGTLSIVMMMSMIQALTLITILQQKVAYAQIEGYCDQAYAQIKRNCAQANSAKTETTQDVDVKCSGVGSITCNVSQESSGGTTITHDNPLTTNRYEASK